MSNKQVRINKIYSQSKLKEPYRDMKFIKRYWIYQWERLPIIPLIMMTAAICAALANASSVFEWGNLISCTVMLTAYLLQIRFADEPKDFEHDNVFYPTRPVQRGLITLKELLILRNISILVFFIAALSLWSLPVFLLSMLQQLYSYLTREEFFVREWLRNRFLLYMFSHYFQLVILSTLTLVALQIPVSDMLLSLLFAISLLALVELARKIQEEKNDKAGDTYSANIGRSKAIVILVLVSFLVSYLSIYISGIAGMFNFSFYIILFSTIMILIFGLNYLKKPDKNNTKTLQFGSIVHYFLCCLIVIVGV